MIKYSTYGMGNKGNFYVSAACLDIFENISFLHRSPNLSIGAAKTTDIIPHKTAFLVISYSYINKTVYEINGQTYSVKEGEFIVQGRGSVSHHRPGKGGSVSYGIRVNPQFCKKYGLCDDMVCHIKSDEKMKDLFLNVVREYDNNPDGDSATTAMIQLLMYVDRHYKKYSLNLDDKETLSDKQMEKVIKYINRNLFNKIRLADMAALVDLHPVYFGYLFKKTCGYSPIAYANFLRCDSAREILLTTDFTPKEVIEACGFYSMSHFKNMYKKLTGRDALVDASTVPVEIKVK
ncbi:MAG: helix-turn-helix transcriptional regulator [Clostridia bacterium]|nr:helix-turn-helix transcriptional regulator [Clostridia bacterium]